MSADFLNLQHIFYQIYLFFSMDYHNLTNPFSYYWPLIASMSMLASLVLIAGVIYLTIKTREVEKLDEKIFGTITIPVFEDGGVIKNERWMKVLSHLEVDSQAEWKTAILEADIILDEMTKKMGYHGDTLGERLQNVEKSDFLTINKAWEAHKVRNSIAHEGSDYLLSKREAKRVVDLYREVFEEFNFI